MIANIDFGSKKIIYSIYSNMEENHSEPERVKLYHFYTWYTNGSPEADDANNEEEGEDDGELLQTPVQTVTERNDFRKSYDMIKGSIKIPGTDGDLDCDIVHCLKGMTKDDMKFQIENHAIRRLHINFIDVDAREEIEVRKYGKKLVKSVLWAKAQKYEIMTMLFRTFVDDEEPTLDNVQKWDFPYRTKTWTGLLWKTCMKLKPSEEYLVHVREVVGRILQFEALVVVENQKRERAKNHKSDLALETRHIS